MTRPQDNAIKTEDAQNIRVFPKTARYSQKLERLWPNLAQGPSPHVTQYVTAVLQRAVHSVVDAQPRRWALAYLFEDSDLVLGSKRSAMQQLTGICAQPVANDVPFGVATIVVEINASSDSCELEHLVEACFPAAEGSNGRTVDQYRVDIPRKGSRMIRAKESERMTLPDEWTQCDFNTCFTATLS